MPTHDPICLSVVLSVHAEIISAFSIFFGKGVEVETRLGVSISEFLSGPMGLDAEYIDRRVQTLFLDGKAVDDPDRALIRDGSVLALSGAMPGLAGATLRRGGFYARMRGEISHRQEEPSALRETGTITVKLFNLILHDLSPILLAKGVRIPGKTFGEFLADQPDRFWNRCLRAAVDGSPVGLGTLMKTDWNRRMVFFRVEQGLGG